MATKLKPGEFDCYSRLADNEPYFLLRAKDKFAPILVMFWVQLALAFGCPSAKAAEAIQCAESMKEWAKNNGGSKNPD